MSIKIRKVKIDASSAVNLQTDLRQTNLIVGVVLRFVLQIRVQLSASAQQIPVWKANQLAVQ
jgi:hypothetical protein